MVHIKRDCVVCGKEFDIEIDDKTKSILTKDVFYGGVIRRGIGNWSQSKWEGMKPDGSPNWVRVHPRWKESWYRLIDLKRLVLHQYTDIEYWECPPCNRRGKKHAIKNSRKK